MSTVTEKIRTIGENYKKPTPRKWEDIGEAIMGLGTVITAVSAFTASPWVTLISAVLTWAGRSIVRFAS